MLSYNDHGSQSSESDIDEEALYKATTGYGKIQKISKNKAHYQSSSEQESSISDHAEQEEEGESPERQPKKVEKVAAIHQRGSSSQDQSEEEDDNSIDHIEERIKRLEMDLEKKIDKHKKEGAEKNHHQIVVEKERPKNMKSNASPPLPKKNEKNPSAGKPHPQVKPHRVSSKDHKQPEEKGKEDYLPPTKKDFKVVQQVEEPKEHKETSPKKKLSKERKEEENNNPSILVDKKRVQSKANTRAELSHPDSTLAKKLSKATKQIQQLSKALQQTKYIPDNSRKQNKRLKEQLAGPKKKRSQEQVERLKDIAATSTNVKLEKEIQLLKIIEGLQTKLKKSISKKLNKSRVGSTSAALLHKGLPSNLIH